MPLPMPMATAMAMFRMLLPLHILLPFLLLHPASSTQHGFRLDMRHVDAAGNFTKLQLLERAALRSKIRVAKLSSKSTHHHTAQAQAPVFASEGEYLIDLAIGTPARPFTAILDTGSDLIWTQCKPCAKCFAQPAPLFDPSRSSTYSKLPCSSQLCKALPQFNCTPDCIYDYVYGDGSSSHGALATETFTFGSRKRASIPNLGFGCGVLNLGGFSNASGLVGFGRGTLSLVSQLRIGKFSYCFTSFNESNKSPLFLGSVAKLNPSADGRVQVGSTRLIRNPVNPSFYYVSLEGITVGATRLPIKKSTFEMKKNGVGGLIIDSGTAVTQLEEKGYKLVKKAFISQMKLPIGKSSSGELDLCFSLPPPGSSSAANVEVPKLIFHFEGGDLELQKENYIMEDSGLLCLTIVGSSEISILGNLQQQNIHFLYDLENEKLSFVPAQCDRM